ncbi:protein FAR-RED IMPAIRED RESPONSE 1-like [Camellia sinensis]|uniref:protein FAR-RED IMPAIRED RESPONSE 1-like n=1 Tax=Camellia sinensis TaxID=4442 RepID=UPI001035639C|nr:protein FAR-RED IMPAIRED RESPONSE 1-like [Camellia sinensis]
MAMCNVGVKTCKIMDYMVNQSECYENVVFIHTDLHNHIQAECRAEVENGDAQGALVYLCAKLDVDPHFFYKYDMCKDNKLQNMFWADSKSQADYVKFGDVLIFDSTYRTNAYKKPFVMLAGVTNHFTTALARIRHNEAGDDAETNNTFSKCYYIHKYKVKDRSWIVTHNPVDAAMIRSCIKFEPFRLPCCHMICVMKAENLTQIPPTSMLHKWTRAASKDGQQWRKPSIDSTTTQNARY